MDKIKRNQIIVVCVAVMLVVVMVSTFMKFVSNSRNERNDIPDLVASQDQQMEFYLHKFNGLILELYKAEIGDGIRSEDSAPLELFEVKVSDALETEEYKWICEQYEELYGAIDEHDIPGAETLGGFKYKVEESLREGYNLLPQYYGWTHVLRNIDTKEFEEANALYKEHFGESIPTEQIGGTIHELIEIVNRSVDEGKNLLPEHYGWQQGDLY